MNKKIIIIFTVLLIIVLIGGFFIIKHFKDKEKNNIIEEYIPQEEITEEQNRQTIVSLYFLDKESNKILPEARLVDIKEIINDPYDKLVNMLIEGPKNEKYLKIIPENTKLNKCYMQNDILFLDFSKEILNYDKNKKDSKNLIIDSLVNTLTELTEVNGIKILIDGKENDEFSEQYKRKLELNN